MSKYDCRHRHRHRHRRRSLAWLALLVPLFAQAQAGPDAAAPAAWVGADTLDGRPSSVRLTLQPANDTAQIVFGEPRNCRLDARLSHRGDGQLQYDLVAASGGRWCNRLYPGRVQLQVQGNQATLQVRSDVAAASTAMWASGELPDAASAPGALRGRWLTQVQTAAMQPVMLQLDLAGREPGDAGGTASYASPRNCRVPLRLEGSTADGAWYSVRPGNGGSACDRLVGRWLVVQAGDAATTLRIRPAIGECTPSCVLERPSR
ncbi:hypothetical protein [Stenotrophomonas sp.]|uniref:hypothetical protein n=1 Tax=Stenotrophomonas sp. TaxID=69392 RepID=UPI00289645D9|nr:hypothetical protein [Stenotrophomonas sp.]